MKNKLLFCLLFLLSVHTLMAQKSLEFGLGLDIESFTLGSQNVFINDSIIFTNYETIKNPINGVVRGDPRFIFYLSYPLIEKNSFKVNSSLFFSQKWLQIFLLRLSDNPQSFPNTFVVPIRKTSIFLPFQFEFAPFSEVTLSQSKFIKSLSINAGIGPSFHLGSIASRIDGYRLNLKNNREDPFFYEVYYQFQDKAHRNITLDYTWSVKMRLIKKIGLQVNSSGSIGLTTKPFSVSGIEYNVPIQRRGLAFILTYQIETLKRSKD